MNVDSDEERDHVAEFEADEGDEGDEGDDDDDQVMGESPGFVSSLGIHPFRACI
jgi:hypothetical protein